MSARQLRARLTRLESSVKQRSYEFAIEPAVVKTMDKDLSRFHELAWDDRSRKREGVPQSPEFVALGAHIAKRAKTINCPPYYGLKEYWMDYDKYWTVSLRFEERSQARVRMEVFKHTPEGEARLRIVALEEGYLGHSEYVELIQLLKTYPEPWVDPKCTNEVVAMRERLSAENLKRRTEKEQHLIKEREERERNKLDQKKNN